MNRLRWSRRRSNRAHSRGRDAPCGVADLLHEGLRGFQPGGGRARPERLDAPRLAQPVRPRPAASGASGPTITKSMLAFPRRRMATAQVRRYVAIGTHSAMLGDPGIARRARYSSVAFRRSASTAQASACSRPPPADNENVHTAAPAWPCLMAGRSKPLRPCSIAQGESNMTDSPVRRSTSRPRQRERRNSRSARSRGAVKAHRSRASSAASACAARSRVLQAGRAPGISISTHQGRSQGGAGSVSAGRGRSGRLSSHARRGDGGDLHRAG